MERIVVVGADAAGMSAAHQALRTAEVTGRSVEVIALEQTSDTSYSACGIPYLVAGLVDSDTDLVARSAAQHRELGVDLRMGTTVTGIDRDRKVVSVTSEFDESSEVAYDQLVLCTGASAMVPDWARDADGTLIDGVNPAKTLEDARYWLDLIAGSGRRGVVVGGGYIGVEMAEALAERGFQTTLATRTRVMSKLDPEMSDRIEEGMRAAGVTVLTDTVVASADAENGRIRSVTTVSGDTIEADVVVLALGVRPSTSLGAEAGLPIGVHGGYLPDDHQRVADDIWAAGDCCESLDRMTGERIFAPLGTHANKQGRVCGFNLGGDESKRFAGVLATAITRFSSGPTYLEIARTGMNTEVAAHFGHDALTLITQSDTASGYMAEATPITVLLTADKLTRRILGAQIVGGAQSGKRIDTVAAALWGEMTVDDLAEMDLAYAPPFATVWEAVQLASRRVSERI